MAPVVPNFLKILLDHLRDAAVAAGVSSDCFLPMREYAKISTMDNGQIVALVQHPACLYQTDTKGTSTPRGYQTDRVIETIDGHDWMRFGKVATTQKKNITLTLLVMTSGDAVEQAQEAAELLKQRFLDHMKPGLYVSPGYWLTLTAVGDESKEPARLTTGLASRILTISVEYPECFSEQLEQAFDTVALGD